MASLQALVFRGVVSNHGAPIQIPDGPPSAVVNISSGESGALPGGDGAPVIVKLQPIGGAVAITWPGGVVEAISSTQYRRLRGEAVTVANA